MSGEIGEQGNPGINQTEGKRNVQRPDHRVKKWQRAAAIMRPLTRPRVLLNLGIAGTMAFGGVTACSTTGGESVSHPPAATASAPDISGSELGSQNELTRLRGEFVHTFSSIANISPETRSYLEKLIKNPSEKFRIVATQNGFDSFILLPGKPPFEGGDITWSEKFSPGGNITGETITCSTGPDGGLIHSAETNPIPQVQREQALNSLINPGVREGDWLSGYDSQLGEVEIGRIVVGGKGWDVVMDGNGNVIFTLTGDQP